MIGHSGLCVAVIGLINLEQKVCFNVLLRQSKAVGNRTILNTFFLSITNAAKN